MTDPRTIVYKNDADLVIRLEDGRIVGTVPGTGDSKLLAAPGAFRFRVGRPVHGEEIRLHFRGGPIGPFYLDFRRSQEADSSVVDDPYSYADVGARDILASQVPRPVAASAEAYDAGAIKTFQTTQDRVAAMALGQARLRAAFVDNHVHRVLPGASKVSARGVLGVMKAADGRIGLGEAADRLRGLYGLAGETVQDALATPAMFAVAEGTGALVYRGSMRGSISRHALDAWAAKNNGAGRGTAMVSAADSSVRHHRSWPLRRDTTETSAPLHELPLRELNTYRTEAAAQGGDWEHVGVEPWSREFVRQIEKFYDCVDAQASPVVLGLATETGVVDEEILEAAGGSWAAWAGLSCTGWDTSLGREIKKTAAAISAKLLLPAERKEDAKGPAEAGKAGDDMGEEEDAREDDPEEAADDPAAESEPEQVPQRDMIRAAVDQLVQLYGHRAAEAHDVFAMLRTVTSDDPAHDVYVRQALADGDSPSMAGPSDYRERTRPGAGANFISLDMKLDPAGFERLMSSFANSPTQTRMGIFNCDPFWDIVGRSETSFQANQMLSAEGAESVAADLWGYAQMYFCGVVPLGIVLKWLVQRAGKLLDEKRSKGEDAGADTEINITDVEAQCRVLRPDLPRARVLGKLRTRATKGDDGQAVIKHATPAVRVAVNCLQLAAKLYTGSLAAAYEAADAPREYTVLWNMHNGEAGEEGLAAARECIVDRVMEKGRAGGVFGKLTFLDTRRAAAAEDDSVRIAQAETIARACVVFWELKLAEALWCTDALRERGGVSVTDLGARLGRLNTARGWDALLGAGRGGRTGLGNLAKWFSERFKPSDSPPGAVPALWLAAAAVRVPEKTEPALPVVHGLGTAFLTELAGRNAGVRGAAVLSPMYVLDPPYTAVGDSPVRSVFMDFLFYAESRDVARMVCAAFRAVERRYLQDVPHVNEARIRGKITTAPAGTRVEIGDTATADGQGPAFYGWAPDKSIATGFEFNASAHVRLAPVLARFASVFDVRAVNEYRMSYGIDVRGPFSPKNLAWVELGAAPGWFARDIYAQVVRDVFNDPKADTASPPFPMHAQMPQIVIGVVGRALGHEIEWRNLRGTCGVAVAVPASVELSEFRARARQIQMDTLGRGVAREFAADDDAEGEAQPRAWTFADAWAYFADILTTDAERATVAAARAYAETFVRAHDAFAARVALVNMEPVRRCGTRFHASIPVACRRTCNLLSRDARRRVEGYADSVRGAEGRPVMLVADACAPIPRTLDEAFSSPDTEYVVGLRDLADSAPPAELLNVRLVAAQIRCIASALRVGDHAVLRLPCTTTRVMAELVYIAASWFEGFSVFVPPASAAVVPYQYLLLFSFRLPHRDALDASNRFDPLFFPIAVTSPPPGAAPPRKKQRPDEQHVHVPVVALRQGAAAVHAAVLHREVLSHFDAYHCSQIRLYARAFESEVEKRTKASHMHSNAQRLMLGPPAGSGGATFAIQHSGAARMPQIQTMPLPANLAIQRRQPGADAVQDQGPGPEEGHREAVHATGYRGAPVGHPAHV